MFNKAILMGRICNALELKTTANGIAVVSFRIAVDRSYQAKGEEKKTDFFNIVAWRTTAEFVSKYFSKGKMILVEGELQTRQYVDKNGSTQNVVELVAGSVHFTGEKKEQTQEMAQNTNNTSQGNPTTYGNPVVNPDNADFEETSSDDDYPF